MDDLRERIERRARALRPNEEDALEHVHRAVAHRARVRRVTAGAVSLSVFALAVVWLAFQFRGSPSPRPREPSPGVAPHLPAHISGVVATEGAIWALGSDGRGAKDGFLLRFDPETGHLVASTPVPGATLIAANDTTVWVSTFERGSVVEVNAATGSVVRTVGLGHLYFAPWLAPADDGVVVRRNDDVVWIGPEGTARVIATVPFSAGVAFAAGDVWAYDESGDVRRFSLETGEVLATVHAGFPGFGGDIGQGTIGAAGGSVWVTGNHGLGRIDPGSDSVVARVPGTGLYGTAITAGGGSVWAVDTRVLWKIDPATNTAIEVTVAGHPNGVAVSGGTVWVSNGTGTLARIPICTPDC